LADFMIFCPLGPMNFKNSAYVVITYYSLQFLSNGDTKSVLQYLFLPSRSI
jgi:hypothetical protein